jgi:glycosyltransferase involved in cell wall biosynthesis
MRILKVAQTYFPFLEGGGLPVKVRAIARRLVQRGHRVTVLTTDWGCRAAVGRMAHLEPDARGWWAGDQGVEAIYLRPWLRYRALSFNPGVIGFCRSELETYDLAHIYGLYDLLGPPVAYFCRRRKIPYALEPMGMFRPMVRSLRLKRVYHRFLASRLIGGAACLIATAEQERRELIEDGLPPARVIVRRNGIEAPEHLPAPGTFRHRWGIPAETKMVLFLGRLVAKKSPDLLMQAFAHIVGASAFPDARLVVAGADEGDGYRRKLEELSARLNLGERVLFTGPLYDEAKWEAYRDADVFVLPSQHENFGNTAGEAVACGTPVIVTDRCGIAPLVAGRAGLVVAFDVNALQESLSRVLKDTALRRRLGEGCNEVAQSLSWEEPIKQLETVYSSVVQARFHA